MKIGIWIAVTDGGDGEHPTMIYSTEEELKKHLGVNDEGFDEYGYMTEIHYHILDVSKFKVEED